MRKFIFSLAAIIVALSIFTVNAQPQQQRQQRPQPQQDGNFTEFQLQVLTKQLELDTPKQAQFKTLYTEYSQKIEALQPKPQARPAQGEERTSRPTDSQVEEMILESFVMAEKSTELKREYYYKFKEILTPQQIFKMYNVERRMRERIVSESDRRAEGGDANGRK